MVDKNQRGVNFSLGGIAKGKAWQWINYYKVEMGERYNKMSIDDSDVFCYRLAWISYHS